MAVSVLVLQQIGLLRQVAPEILPALAERARIVDYGRREMVSGKDDLVQEMGFLLDGRLQGVDYTVDGRMVGLYFVEPGDFFGEMPVIDGVPPGEFLVAINKSKVLMLDAAASRQLISDTPQLTRVILNRLTSRVRALSAQRTLLALANPFQRLCLQLLLLGKGNPQTVDPVPTHQELAIMINTSRETVTRAFQHLLSDLVLSRDGSQLILLKPDYLLQVGKGIIASPKI